MAFLKHLASYIPSLIVLVLAVVVFSSIARSFTFQAETKPPDFKPVTANPLKFVTASPFKVGQQVTITDGVCNNAKETLQVTYTVGFEEIVNRDVSQLSARNIVVIPVPGTTTIQTPRPLSPGCTGADPVSGPLPPTLGPGKWRLYITMTIMGPQSGQMQRISMVSAPVEVVSGP